MAVNLQRPQSQRKSDRRKKIKPPEPLSKHPGPGPHPESPGHLHQPPEAQQQQRPPQDIEGLPVASLRAGRGMVGQEAFAIPTQGNKTDPDAQGELHQHPDEGNNADDRQALQEREPHWID